MKEIRKKISQLTLFDKLIISVVFVSLSLLAYIFFRKNAYITVTVKVGGESVHYQPWLQGAGSKSWFSNMFYEGMLEEDGLGRKMAEVMRIKSFDVGGGLKDLYVTTRLRVVYSKASNEYTFKGRPVLVGSTIKLNLDDLLVEGLIVNVEGVKDPREREEIIVNAKIIEENATYLETSGTSEYIAESLEKGQIIKDDQGKEIVKILDKHVEDAQKLVITDDGRVLINKNPLRKDVYLTLKINAIKIGNRYYVYDDIPILVGQGLPINTSEVSIWPTVTKIRAPN